MTATRSARRRGWKGCEPVTVRGACDDPIRLNEFHYDTVDSMRHETSPPLHTHVQRWVSHASRLFERLPPQWSQTRSSNYPHSRHIVDVGWLRSKAHHSLHMDMNDPRPTGPHCSHQRCLLDFSRLKPFPRVHIPTLTHAPNAISFTLPQYIDLSCRSLPPCSDSEPTRMYYMRRSHKDTSPRILDRNEPFQIKDLDHIHSILATTLHRPGRRDLL
nr:hypothetical protein CFP56_78501 [Quercus suber]